MTTNRSGLGFLLVFTEWICRVAMVKEAKPKARQGLRVPEKVPTSLLSLCRRLHICFSPFSAAMAEYPGTQDL